MHPRQMRGENNSFRKLTVDRRLLAFTDSI